MPSWRIPLSDVDLGKEEAEAVQRVLASGWLSMGQEVEQFESEFAAMIGVRHALAVANGTAALHLAMLTLGVKTGDEVVQPALNFVAGANMTVAVGATPVFADVVSPHEPLIDPVDVERCLTPRTRAVMVMHYGGYICDMEAIQSICRQRGIAIIEDACHAVGAGAGGKKAGAMSDVGCFSFFSNKNMVTGEGGMVVTDSDDLAKRLRLFRSHGMTTLTWERHQGHASSYDVLVNGFNYRFDEIRAAMGRAQLKKLLPNNTRRNALVAYYKSLLSDLPGVAVPFASYEGETACHLMVALASDGEARQRLVAALHEAGIQTSMHYPLVTGFGGFSGVGRISSGGLPNSMDFASRAFTLPLYPTMTFGDVEQVCSVIAAVLSQDMGASPRASRADS